MAIDPRRIWALGSVLAAGVLLVLLAAASWQEVAPRVNAAPQPGILIDIGGHRLHIHCQGSGSPTVVLEAGMSGWSVDWARVQPEVSRHTRTCAYDRAGYGWSDEAPGLRSSAQVAKELRALLAGSAIEEPIVLVGHSLGGLHAQMFARTYPASVAGLVLIDSVHRDQSDRMAATRGSYEDRLVRLTGVLSSLAPRVSCALSICPRQWLPPGCRRRCAHRRSSSASSPSRTEPWLQRCEPLAEAKPRLPRPGRCLPRPMWRWSRPSSGTFHLDLTRG